VALKQGRAYYRFDLSGDCAVILLAENTENRVSDGESYVLEDLESDEPNAGIFSEAGADDEVLQEAPQRPVTATVTGLLHVNMGL